MHRYRVFLVIIVLSLITNGCDGSGSSSDSTGAAVVDSSFSIDLSKVSGYNSSDPIEDQYLAVINYLRSQHLKCNDHLGIEGPSTPLTWNADLAAAALEHSQDMNISGHYGHTGSGTPSDITGTHVGHASSFSERINYNGYSGNTTGENIANSASKPNPVPSDYWVTVMEGWMKSTSGHCSNIMHPNFEDFGMAEVRADVNATGWYLTYWTQNFGGP